MKKLRRGGGLYRYLPKNLLSTADLVGARNKLWRGSS
jgi:hypothetical protein